MIQKLDRKSFPMVPKSCYKVGFIMLTEPLEKIPIFACAPCTSKVGGTTPLLYIKIKRFMRLVLGVFKCKKVNIYHGVTAGIFSSLTVIQQILEKVHLQKLVLVCFKFLLHFWHKGFFEQRL